MAKKTVTQQTSPKVQKVEIFSSVVGVCGGSSSKHKERDRGPHHIELNLEDHRQKVDETSTVSHVLQRVNTMQGGSSPSPTTIMGSGQPPTNSQYFTENRMKSMVENHYQYYPPQQ